MVRCLGAALHRLGHHGGYSHHRSGHPRSELYAILFGLFKAGAVPVVIDPGMGLRPMLRCLAAVDPQAFIGIPQAHAVRVLFRRTFRGVHTSITVGRRWLWGGQTLAMLGRTPSTSTGSPRIAGDDELLMIAFTTGSTGPAKAVEMTHGNLEAMVEQTRTLAAREDLETSLVTLPMFGVLDLLLGSSLVLPPLTPSKVGATDPLHVVDAINRFQVHTLFASPPSWVHCSITPGGTDRSCRRCGRCSPAAHRFPITW